MTREQAIKLLADYMLNMEIHADSEATDAAHLLLKFIEEELGMRKIWKGQSSEGH